MTTNFYSEIPVLKVKFMKQLVSFGQRLLLRLASSMEMKDTGGNR